MAVAAATPAPIKLLAAFDLMALLAPDLILSLVSSSTKMKYKIYLIYIIEFLFKKNIVWYLKNFTLRIFLTKSYDI